MEDKDELEKKLSQTLKEGEMEKEKPSKLALNQLSPKYEIRIPVQNDPIVEETRIIRNIVREIDHRYDHYDDKSKKTNNNGKE